MGERGTEAEVRIREFEPGDAEAVHAWFNNERATATLMETRAEFSLEDARRWVERAMDTSGEDRKFAIEVEGHDGAVGFTALYGLFRETAPELGALIGADLEVRGVGREAERQTVERAFTEYGAHRVYGRIPDYNSAAKKAVAWQGWQHEGTMREHIRRPDGTLVDCEVWGVTRADWEARWRDGK